MGLITDIAGGGLVSGARAANNASDQQARFAGIGIEEQRAARESANARVGQNLQPFVQTGQGALPGLDSLITDPNAQKSFIQDNPFFDSLADDAQRRLFNNQAARGKVGSGGTAEALQNSVLLLGNDLLSQNINQRQNLVNTGLDAAKADSALFSNNTVGTANNISDLFTQVGNARAAGQIGSFNAQRGELNNAINTGLGLLDSGIFGEDTFNVSELFGGGEGSNTAQPASALGSGGGSSSVDASGIASLGSSAAGVLAPTGGAGGGVAGIGTGVVGAGGGGAGIGVGGAAVGAGGSVAGIGTASSGIGATAGGTGIAGAGVGAGGGVAGIGTGAAGGAGSASAAAGGTSATTSSIGAVLGPVAVAAAAVLVALKVTGDAKAKDKISDNFHENSSVILNSQNVGSVQYEGPQAQNGRINGTIFRDVKGNAFIVDQDNLKKAAAQDEAGPLSNSLFGYMLNEQGEVIDEVAFGRNTGGPQSGKFIRLGLGGIQKAFDRVAAGSKQDTIDKAARNEILIANDSGQTGNLSDAALALLAKDAERSQKGSEAAR